MCVKFGHIAKYRIQKPILISTRSGRKALVPHMRIIMQKTPRLTVVRLVGDGDRFEHLLKTDRLEDK